jgi:hypothetical protein
MNGQISLLNKKLSEAPTTSSKTSYKVYIEGDNGSVYSTKLHSEVETVNDAISQAIKNFNQNLKSNLPHNIDLYELYAAKNGKRDTGLPSFEKTQPLSKVGKERFFLVCLAKDVRLLSSESLISSKAMEMKFEEKSKKGES